MNFFNTEYYNNYNNNDNSIKSYFYDSIIYNKDFISCFLIIFMSDIILKMCFGNKARWFQLHSLINTIVTKSIIVDVINIYTYPSIGYKNLDNHNVSYYILILHLYHILTFKNLTYIDYFHHILFVGFGVLPVIFNIQSNQIYLGYIACNGIPGIIEYGSLALYKNNKITLYKQKCICSMLYIYLRLPLCIVGVCYNYIAYNYNYINDNKYLSLYINILLYLNGTFFTHLTLQSFYRVKYLTNNEIIKNKHNLENIIKNE